MLYYNTLLRLLGAIVDDTLLQRVELVGVGERRERANRRFGFGVKEEGRVEGRGYLRRRIIHCIMVTLAA
jgi:hypothetical protein